jgi:hypothetical protein
MRWWAGCCARELPSLTVEAPDVWHGCGMADPLLRRWFHARPEQRLAVTRPIGLSASRRYVPQGAATSGRQRARALPKPRL